MGVSWVLAALGADFEDIGAKVYWRPRPPPMVRSGVGCALAHRSVVGLLPPVRRAAPYGSACIMPTLRSARGTDLPGLARLEAASFPDPWSERMLASAIADLFSLVLVAEADGPAAEGLAGYAVFRRGADEAELLSLAVAPEARRHGLGRRLVEDGLARVRDEGARTCYLEVRPGNEPAVALYRRLGFRQVGRRRAYYRDGSDALVMALRLP